MLRCPLLNKKGDQFTGTISRQDKISRNVAIAGNCISQRSVFSVRIGGKNLCMCGYGFAGLRGKPQRINISTKFNDILFFQIVVAAYLFDITSVKNRFCVQSVTSIV